VRSSGRVSLHNHTRLSDLHGSTMAFESGRHRAQLDPGLTPQSQYQFSSADLQHSRHLELQNANYPRKDYNHHDPSLHQPQSHLSSYYTPQSDQTSSAFVSQRYPAAYQDWPTSSAPGLHGSPQISIEDSQSPFGDWSLFDLHQAQSVDATAYQSSPHLTPYLGQGHKRASSSSSHASFAGPHTPRASYIPRVEVFDSEGHGCAPHEEDQINWPEETTTPLSEDEVKEFHSVFGVQYGGGGQEDHTYYQLSRDVPRPQDLRIRQLMMSQESNVSSTSMRMGPPALPRTESTDTDGGFRPDHSLPKLDRTMSDIYQDSLYNPNLHQTPASPTKPELTTTVDTSPNAQMIRERLAAANSDHLKKRSQSPTNNILRDRSPFKPNSLESPRDSQFAREAEAPPRLQSAYRMREWQKVQRDRAAAAQHQPSQIKAEVDEPKTISPKEAMLDYEEDDQASKIGSLFPEEPPVKRRKQEHSTVPSLKPTMTRESTRGSNASEISQPSFGSMATSRRESSQSNGRSQMNYPFFAQAQRQASNASNATAISELTNDFPNLTPTESSRSEQDIAPSRKRGLTASSPKIRRQDSDTTNADPEELTYTCTYHGCTKRFESQSALQKHKRDIHHSTAHHSRNTSMTGAGIAAASASPASSSRTASVAPASISAAVAPNDPINAEVDPADPEGHEASPSAIAERNSQAGPHICNRINPSTGRPCNSHFSRPYDLTRHEDTIHNNKKQKVRCMYCKDEKTFSRNDALTRHMRVVHPDVNFEGKGTKKGGR